MKVSVRSIQPAQAAVDLLAVPLSARDAERRRVPTRFRPLDRALGGGIATVLKSGDFHGKAGESAVFYPDAGALPKRVTLVGLGPEDELGAEALRRASAVLVTTTAARRGETAAFATPAVRRLRPPHVAQALAEGAVLAGYRFDRYVSKRDEAAPPPRAVALLFGAGADLGGARAGCARGVALGESQNLARRLSNEPPNALPPAVLAREAQRVAKEVGLGFRAFDVPELKRRKMGGILAVGAGSANSPRLIVLEHNAPPRTRKRGARSAPRRPTVCLVGKGITFDSGGISIKPSAGMDEMKHDMSGAAAVIGALRAAALLRIPLHVVGVVAAAENLPSGTAYRPGDVVTTMSGLTVEVLNTDAEGRIVLSDALHFARTEYAPEAIVDLATLTGACVVALGRWASGVMGNNEQLIERIRAAGEATGERVWPLPLWAEHRKQVRSKVADIKNTGGREGGSLTAAAFLSYFSEGTPWAHLDIAGTGWTTKTGPYQPFGATGIGVRLLLELLRTWKEGRPL